MELSKTKSSNSSTTDILGVSNGERIQMGARVENLPHLLDLLTDLYNDPVSATVREIVSNATDATALMPEASRRPVEITLPTVYDSIFVVRDHGVGMSTDTVKKVFATYGASTKGDNYNQIGAYGLGAKAPLSYVHEYAVSTTRDGITTNFTITREDSGTYTTITSVVDTGESSGTVVTIPVELKDIDEFSDALESYREYSFVVPIQIDGVEYFGNENYVEFSPIKFDLENEHSSRVWILKTSLTKIFKGTFGDSYGTNLDISYSLSGWRYNALNATSSSYRFSSKDVILELKPGYVDFSSSRDAITVNDRSRLVENIVSNTLRKNEDYVRENIFAFYKNLTNTEAVAFLSEISSSLGEAKEGKVYSSRQRFIGELEDFTTKTGFNPITLWTRSSEEDINVAVFGSSTNDYSILYLVTDSLFSSSLRNYESSAKRYHRQNVKDINEKVVGRLTKGSQFYQKISAFQVMADLHLEGLSEKVVLVTSVDSLSIKKFTRARATIFSKIFDGYRILLTEKKALSSVELEAIEQFTGKELETIELAQLLEKVKAIQKEIRDARPKEEKESKAEFTVFYYKGISDYDDKSLASLRTGERKSVTSSEIINSNSVLVLSEYDKMEAIIGAVNSGFDLLNRDLYIVTGDTRRIGGRIAAAQLKAFENYDSVIVSKNWRANSTAAKKLKNDNVYHGSVLKNKVMKLTDAELMKSIVRSHIYDTNQVHNMRHLTDYLATLESDAYNFTRILNSIADSYDADFEKVIPIENAKEEIKARFGDESLTQLERIFEYFTKMRYSSSNLDDALFLAILNNRSDFTRSVATDFIFDKVLRTIDERVNLES